MGDGPPKTGRRAGATLLLGFVCVAVFGWTWWASGFPLVENAGRLEPAQLRVSGALDWLQVREAGAWWRLFSAVLLHGSWWHLAFNLWALFVLGSSVELNEGRSTWFFVVALAAVGSGLAALAWGSANMVVGISGVVFGLGGFLVTSDALARYAPPAISRKTSIQSSELDDSISDSSRAGMVTKELAFWLGATLAVGFVWPELSQAGHVGGLVAGVLAAVAARGPRWLALGLLMAIAGATFAVRATLGEPSSTDGWERLGYAFLDADRPEDAWPAFDRALEASDGDDPARAEWMNAAAYARATGSQDEMEWQRGLVLVRESLEADPENPNRLDTLGWLQCQLGMVSEGRESLRRAADLMADGPSDEVEQHLAACTRN